MPNLWVPPLNYKKYIYYERVPIDLWKVSNFSPSLNTALNTIPFPQPSFPSSHPTPPPPPPPPAPAPPSGVLQQGHAVGLGLPVAFPLLGFGLLTSAPDTWGNPPATPSTSAPPGGRGRGDVPPHPRHSPPSFPRAFPRKIPFYFHNSSKNCL